MKKTIIAIGGGELRTKTTHDIDKYIADTAKQIAGERRANALFFPTASHDSLPYFNTFRKTYTSDFDIKVDVALLTKKNISLDKIQEKIDKADMIYIGGGNTKHMLQVWRDTGVDNMLLEFYNSGRIISGLSAGAICWFTKMYSDSDIISGTSDDYKVYDGLGWLDGIICPHYDSRQQDFDNLVDREFSSAVALEDNSAIVIENGEIVKSLSSGGNAYRISKTTNGIIKERI